MWRSFQDALIVTALEDSNEMHGSLVANCVIERIVSGSAPFITDRNNQLLGLSQIELTEYAEPNDILKDML